MQDSGSELTVEVPKQDRLRPQQVHRNPSVPKACPIQILGPSLISTGLMVFQVSWLGFRALELVLGRPGCANSCHILGSFQQYGPTLGSSVNPKP